MSRDGHGERGSPDRRGERGSRVGRAVTAFEMGLRESARMPVLLALLVFLPAYFVGVLVYLLPASPVGVGVPGSGTVTVASTEAYGVLLVPMVCSFVGGLAGLFLTVNAPEADARLVVAGFRPVELLVARFGVLLGAALVAVGVSIGALSVEFVPESVGWYVAASLVAGLVYGLVGALAGLVLSRLAGVYLMLFVPMIDVFFLQNPLVRDAVWIADYLPGDGVVEMAMDAGFSTAVALDPLGRALAYLGLVAIVTAIASYRSIDAA